MPVIPFVVAVILLPLTAVWVHQWAVSSSMAGMEPPPPDFGSGHMFDSIAPRYDLVNRVLALGMDTAWRKRMVQSIQQHLEAIDGTAHPQSPPHILDLATGTADVAILLAQAIPYAKIEGIDPSVHMLEHGRTKISSHRHPAVRTNVSLDVYDAQNLQRLPANSFDAATMAFGIRNVPNRPHALCEIHRVLKPSSRFCILEFSEPDDSFGVLGKVARAFIRHVVPAVGGILSGAPREYWHLQNSIQDFPSPQEFVQLLHQLQCQHDQFSSFHVQELIQLNFGSVQLYVIQVLKSENGHDDSTALPDAASADRREDVDSVQG